MGTWMKLTYPQSSALLCLVFGLFVFLGCLFYSSSNLVTLFEWDLFKINSVIISFSFVMDKMSLTFSSIVMLISFSVMLFSVNYMSGDMNLNFFILMVLVFILSMNILIFIPHLIFLLLGWDGLGLSSYILIIYYQNENSLSSGMTTAITNRIGDCLLILAGCLMFTSTWYQSLILNGCFVWCLLLMFASMTKSAQMPFSAWLPAAMAAPTPVSSLVHSSTLVTAGVFILIRFYPTLSTFYFFNSYLFWVGFFTSFLASMAACFENDLKKIIALSTLSQLGVMVMSLGMGQPLLAFMHMVTHAMFKALLFLCAGMFIHSSQSSQDIRQMGGYWKQMPATSACMNIANISLCGLPFLAGFYSKDLILEVLFLHNLSFITWLLVSFSLCLTAVYSMRMMLFSLWSPYKHLALSNNTDESLYMMAPSLFLLFGALVGGAFMSWWMVPYLMDFCLPFLMKIFCLFFVFFFFFCGYFLKLNNIVNGLLFFSSLSFLSFILNFLVFVFNKYSGEFVKMERSWMELFSGKGSMSFLIYNTILFTKTQFFSLQVMLSVMVLIISLLMILK